MLTPWVQAFPATAKPLIEEIDHLLGYKISKIIEEGPNSTLTATENAQPAIMASSILILRILEHEFHSGVRLESVRRHPLVDSM